MKEGKHGIDLLHSYGWELGPALSQASLESLHDGLRRLMGRANGAYLFDESLLLRPLESVGVVLGVRQWNDLACWKGEYEDRQLDDYLFFGEDAFGMQFCMDSSGRVSLFGAETGEFELVANTIEAFADWVLSDIDQITGRSILQEWKKVNGPLASGCRLFPKVPFVCGGEFQTSNLASVSDVDSMRFRGALARQIRGLEDGQEIVLRVTDTPLGRPSSDES